MVGPIAWISGATALVRFVVLYFFSGSLGVSAGFPDENNYYLPAARMLLENGMGFFRSPRSLWNGPLNPIWIGLFNANIPVVKAANVALFSLSSGVLAAAVGHRFGWRKAALVAIGLLAYPPTYHLVPTLLTEPLYVSLLMLSFSSLLLRDFSQRGFVESGILLGLATLVRPTSQLFPPMLGILALVLRKSPWSKNLLLHGLVAFAVCVPTMSWNWAHFGKVGIANGLGAVVYLGSDLRRDGDEPVYSGVDFDTYRTTSPQTHLDTEGDARLLEVARERILKHPVQVGELFIRKAGRYLFGSFNGYFWPFDGLVEKIAHDTSRRGKMEALFWPALHTVVVVAALIAFLGRSCPPMMRLYVGVVALYFVALHMVTFPIPRMFLPLFPYMLVLGVVGVCNRKEGYKAKVLFSVTAPLLFAFVSAPRHRLYPTEVSEAYISLFETRNVGALVERNGIQAEGSFRVVGADPYEVYRFDRIPLVRTQVVSFGLGVQCPDSRERKGQGQIFWAVNGETFDEARSTVFPLRSIDGVHVVRPALSPAWNGALNFLRVDLPPEFLGCGVMLDEVQVLD